MSTNRRLRLESAINRYWWQLIADNAAENLIEIPEDRKQEKQQEIERLTNFILTIADTDKGQNARICAFENCNAQLANKELNHIREASELTAWSIQRLHHTTIEALKSRNVLRSDLPNMTLGQRQAVLEGLEVSAAGMPRGPKANQRTSAYAKIILNSYISITGNNPSKSEQSRGLIPVAAVIFDLLGIGQGKAKTAIDTAVLELQRDRKNRS